MKRLNRHLRYILLLAATLIQYSAYADTLTISYVKHPQIENKFVPFMKRVYESAGIKARFIPITSERGIINIQNGLYDGGVVRLERTLKPYPNIIKVGPPLTNVSTKLLCVKTVLCDVSVLRDSNKTIISSIGANRQLTALLDYPIEAKMYLLETYDVFDDMLDGGKVDYAIFHANKGQLQEKLSQRVNDVEIFSQKGFHVLAAKHKDKADLIAAAIESHLYMLD